MDDLTFNVMARRCDQCLFGPNKIVSDERKADVLEACEKHDLHFVCHKATMVGQDVCCRGFYEQMPGSTFMQISCRLGWVEYVEEKRPEINLPGHR